MINGLKAGTTGDLGMVEFDPAQLPAAERPGRHRRLPARAEARGLPGVDALADHLRRGAVYGVPQDIGPMALYYRKDLFERPACRPRRPGTSTREAAAHPGGMALIANFPTSPPGSPRWPGSAARWFTVDGDTWKVDMTDEAQQVAEYWQKLIDDKQVDTNPGIGESSGKGTRRRPGGLGSPPRGATANRDQRARHGRQVGRRAAAAVDGGDGRRQLGRLDHRRVGELGAPYEAAQFAMWAFGDPAALALNNENGGQFPAHTAGPTCRRSQPSRTSAAR